MTFGFSVQMEALNGLASIDESYVTISSDTLGKCCLGSENSAGYALMGSVYTPGRVVHADQLASTSAFIPVTGSAGFRQAALSSLTEVAGNNDVPRITYFTPSFNGLTVGVSYAPSGEGNAGNNGPVNFNAGTVSDIFDIGVGYSQSFNGVDIGLAARWGTGDRNGSLRFRHIDRQTRLLAGIASATYNDANGRRCRATRWGTAGFGRPRRTPRTWAIGGSVGVAGFTFGAPMPRTTTTVQRVRRPGRLEHWCVLRHRRSVDRWSEHLPG